MLENTSADPINGLELLFKDLEVWRFDSFTEETGCATTTSLDPWCPLGTLQPGDSVTVAGTMSGRCCAPTQLSRLLAIVRSEAGLLASAEDWFLHTETTLAIDRLTPPDDGVNVGEEFAWNLEAVVPSDASTVLFSVTDLDGLAFVSSVVPQGSVCTADSLICRVPGAPGETVTIVLRYRADTADTADTYGLVAQVAGATLRRAITVTAPSTSQSAQAATNRESQAHPPRNQRPCAPVGVARRSLPPGDAIPLVLCLE